MPIREDVVAIATRFPGVEETTSHGRPVGTAFLGVQRTNPDALVEDAWRTYALKQHLVAREQS